MKYRQHRDWRISEIGFGCYGLSGAYGTVDKDAFVDTIWAAYEQGINFFDTAQGYGDAETFLGKAVAPFRDDVYVATKLSGKAGNPDLSRESVRQACETSLKRLNTDVIDLYQVHSDDPDTPVLETIAALESLVEDGKIRQYGLNHLSLSRVRTYAEYGDPFSMLLELSPVARTSIQTLIPVCEKHDIAVFAFSITGRGILTGRYSSNHVFETGDIRRIDPLFKRERFESSIRIQEYLSGMSTKYGKTAVQIGIAWVLAQPQVVCALTGTSSPEHLAENTAACQITLNPGDLKAMNRFLADEERRLAVEQRKTIRHLLTQPLADDPEQAFNDLVYILETAIMVGDVEEQDVIAAFRELFTLRDSLDSDAWRKMQGIQAYLRDAIV